MYTTDVFEFLELFSSKIPCKKIFDHFCLCSIAILSLLTKKSKGKLWVMKTPFVHQGFPPFTNLCHCCKRVLFNLWSDYPCLCDDQKDFLKGFTEPLFEHNTTKSASFWSVYHEMSVPPWKEWQQSILGCFCKFYELILFPR